MALSVTGPFLVESALPAAPVPRPPAPISAICSVPPSAPWTWGTTIPAKADAAAILPVVLIKSRREATLDCLLCASLILLYPTDDARLARIQQFKTQIEPGKKCPFSCGGGPALWLSNSCAGRRRQQCSAGFQPAVSPTSSRHARSKCRTRRGLETRDTADWTSALRSQALTGKACPLTGHDPPS